VMPSLSEGHGGHGSGPMTSSTMGDGNGERVWQAEGRTGLGGLGEGGRSRLDLEEER